MRHTFHPKMNQEEVARPDRKIGALLVADVSVTGMTTTELSKYLADQTSHRWRDLEMTVDLLRSGEKIIYVRGTLEDQVQFPTTTGYHLCRPFPRLEDSGYSLA